MFKPAPSFNTYAEDLLKKLVRKTCERCKRASTKNSNMLAVHSTQ